jgi:4-hydroxybenzoate polyprenyltransferase
MKAIAARLDAYEKLVRLDRPIGILLLLWPTLWGLWLTHNGWPQWRLAWVFLVGAVLMRSSGCAINDWADRAFDPHVERTRDRPLAAGLIQPWEALAIAVVLALAALALVVVELNTLSLKLAVIAFALATVYPFLKRFFIMPQAWLGIAFGFGIPMAFAAQRNLIPDWVWWLLAANVFWTIAYDTEYAMVDRDDDRKLGLKTSAILFGTRDVPAVMACYAIFLALMVGVGVARRFGFFYFAGVAAAALIAAYHYRLIKGRTREGCFKAFVHNNWIGAVVFGGIALDTVDWRELLQ